MTKTKAPYDESMRWNGDKMTRHQGVRLMAGALRGRRLAIPREASLRPTPGLLRETLFNWLQPYVDGAYGLDVCAGSGALGFEALSRGAASMTFVERSRQAALSIKSNMAHFGLRNVSLQCGDARLVLSRLAAQGACYDMAFLDPPFTNPMLAPQLITLLLKDGMIRPGGLLYVERPVGAALLSESRLRLYRQSHCGRSQGTLYVVDEV
jgi:16S rRNA (guanine966-N2)-methyltransferase